MTLTTKTLWTTMAAVVIGAAAVVSVAAQPPGQGFGRGHRGFGPGGPLPLKKLFALLICVFTGGNFPRHRKLTEAPFSQRQRHSVRLHPPPGPFDADDLELPRFTLSGAYAGVPEDPIFPMLG